MLSKRNIVIEGMDATGKSTLARSLLAKFPDRAIIPSEGPEVYEGEIKLRIERYASIKVPVIFDRHPCVSQPIYGSLRGGEVITDEQMKTFYDSNPFFIYCRRNSNQPIRRHTVKKHDSENHLELIRQMWSNIEKLYDEWALEHAHLVYRIGDDIEGIW